MNQRQNLTSLPLKRLTEISLSEVVVSIIQKKEYMSVDISRVAVNMLNNLLKLILVEVLISLHHKIAHPD